MILLPSGNPYFPRRWFDNSEQPQKFLLLAAFSQSCANHPWIAQDCAHQNPPTLSKVQGCSRYNPLLRQKHNTRTASRDDTRACLRAIAARILSCTLCMTSERWWWTMAFLWQSEESCSDNANSRPDNKLEWIWYRTGTALFSYMTRDVHSPRRHWLSLSINCRQKINKTRTFSPSRTCHENGGENDGRLLWFRLQHGLLRDSNSAKPLWGIVKIMPWRLHFNHERCWKDVQALERPDRSHAVGT